MPDSIFKKHALELEVGHERDEILISALFEGDGRDSADCLILDGVVSNDRKYLVLFV